MPALTLKTAIRAALNAAYAAGTNPGDPVAHQAMENAERSLNRIVSMIELNQAYRKMVTERRTIHDFGGRGGNLPFGAPAHMTGYNGREPEPLLNMRDIGSRKGL